MSSKDLLTILFERGNAMQQFWGFYITVAGALLAFFGSGQRSWILALALSLVFVGFAYVNGYGMYDIARQRQALFNILGSFHPPSHNELDAWSSPSTSQEEKKRLLSASTPPSPRAVAKFHIASDIAVLIAIWLLTSDLVKKGACTVCGSIS